VSLKGAEANILIFNLQIGRCTSIFSYLTIFKGSLQKTCFFRSFIICEIQFQLRDLLMQRFNFKSNYENNQQDALYRLIYYSKSALHVSGDVFAHHQEHLTVFTVSGGVHPSCCRLPAGSNLGEHLQIL